MNADSDGYSQLFILRLWRVQLSEGQLEWRGRLQHAHTNEIRYFRDWAALIPSLLAMLREVESPSDDLPVVSSCWTSPETEIKDPQDW